MLILPAVDIGQIEPSFAISTLLECARADNLLVLGDELLWMWKSGSDKTSFPPDNRKLLACADPNLASRAKVPSSILKPGGGLNDYLKQLDGFGYLVHISTGGLAVRHDSEIFTILAVSLMAVRQSLKLTPFLKDDISRCVFASLDICRGGKTRKAKSLIEWMPSVFSFLGSNSNGVIEVWDTKRVHGIK
jgi:hypothetical protein